MRKAPVLLILLTTILLAPQSEAPGGFDLPPLPKASRFGNLLISRLSEQHGERPVSFSHWSHRTRYTCRVCHFELEFKMEVNATEITEDKCRSGQFCGACHDGDVAFSHTEENCKKCHSGDIDGPSWKFKQLRKFPKAPYGNKIDWMQAVAQGLIQPRQSVLEKDFVPIAYTRALVLEAEWSLISPALFPHEAHRIWLDCADCHPEPFNIKKKTTEHFEMRYNLAGKFCGVCHMRVAFPLNDCKRCHPKMNVRP
jgi:c(7)-type cytochrome triheme protein